MVDGREALLLHCIRAENQRIFYTVPRAKGDDATNDNYYDKAVKLLENHFTLEKNLMSALVIFWKKTQLTGETVDDYVIGLRQMGIPCKYTDGGNEAIRDQLTEKN